MVVVEAWVCGGGGGRGLGVVVVAVEAWVCGGGGGSGGLGVCGILTWC